MVRNARFRRTELTLAACTLLGVAAAGMFAPGCASTEFFNEGPGQAADRSSGAVPPGAIGVCRVTGTKRPPIVNEKLWENARECTPRTPAAFIRLGYPSDPETDKRVASISAVLDKAQQEQGGNATFIAMLRQVREQSSKDPDMRTRVAKESARTDTCDFTYLLNTMVKERARLEDGNVCSVEAYDQAQRTETCIFETNDKDAVWISAAWDCVARTNQIGDAQSCHRLCAYDDYCTSQVNCAAPDLELLLCVMGVCVPEQRAGF